MIKQCIKVLLIPWILCICSCFLFDTGITLKEQTSQRTASPTFYPTPSFIDEPVTVTMECTTQNAVIYYSVNDIEPDYENESTMEYTGPITVQPGTYLQAYAKALGQNDSFPVSGYYSASESAVQLGINIAWFNTWNESQPLANVASTARSTDMDTAIPVDIRGELAGDAGLVIYEGGNPGGSGAGGGAQYGVHRGSFTGQAELRAGGATLGEMSYDAGANRTSFTYTTTAATNSTLYLENTKRLPADTSGTGIRDFKLMRPGHTESDFLNKSFVSAMEPFSAFRVGPNWGDMMYSTDVPVWSERGKPAGMFAAGVDNSGSAPLETLIKMANELETDLWICLPPFADETYIRDIFNVLFFGSDGVTPYTSVQSNPEWAPLDPDRALYFEIGNEIWNWAYPFGIGTTHMQELAEAEIAAGDPHHYRYGTSDNVWYAIRCRVAYLTLIASAICRDVVGDGNMMTRFRPVISGQSSYPFIGRVSLNYLKCVYGGYGWFEQWSGGNYPGQFDADNLITPEDGRPNQFGNEARPLSYWIYGYATAPYVNGETVAELFDDFNGSVKGNMATAIQDARDFGILPLAYEGGIETYHNYTDSGIGTVIEDMLGYWYAHGGGLFLYYAFAGNNGSGIYPDLTRQDPALWPKVRAVRNIAGLP